MRKRWLALGGLLLMLSMTACGKAETKTETGAETKAETSKENVTPEHIDSLAAESEREIIP